MESPWETRFLPAEHNFSIPQDISVSVGSGWRLLLTLFPTLPSRSLFFPGITYLLWW